MLKIQVLQNKEENNHKTLFVTDSYENPRLIGNILKTHNVNSHSSFDYMCLKAWYQKMEKDQLKTDKITNDLVYWIQVEGNNFRVKTKNSYRSILKTFVLYKNILVNKKICCEYCKKEISEKEVTLDHWIPRSAGGLDEINNLNVSCMRCNKAKGSLHPNKDIRLFNCWKQYVKQNSEKYILNFLFKNAYFTLEDGNYLMSKLSMSMEMKCNLCLEMMKKQLPIEGQFIDNMKEFIKDKSFLNINNELFLKLKKNQI